jgi:hypothetical protein
MANEILRGYNKADYDGFSLQDLFWRFLMIMNFKM